MTIRGCLLLLVAASSCVFSEHDSARIALPPDAPVAIEHDCALAQTRCSRCHSIDRVRTARVASPTHWQAYVHRMRLQPQSGIVPAEEPMITRCLVYQSFGPAGLSELATGAPQ